MIFDQALTVFSNDASWLFATLQSSLHEIWARGSGAGSKMKTDLRYAPTTFEAFPLPTPTEDMARIADEFEGHRMKIMLSRNEGLTDTYKRVHNPAEQSEDIIMLRHLHADLDQAVTVGYGWNDVELGHGFRETTHGVRFTISEMARRTVLDRLLLLNHQRYEQEVVDDLHHKSVAAKRSGKGNSGKAATQGELL